MTTPFAFVFPGQGSQSVGMLDAWGDHPVVKACLSEASDALGEDIGGLISSGPKELLGLTTNTQPVMLVAGVAAFRVWMSDVGVAPAVVAGHSLGEYSALVAANSLSLGDAVSLVRFRAQAMQDAVPVGVGAMSAVLGMPSQDVVAICEESSAASGEVVEAVNFNDPAQTVIAGSAAGVAHASERLKARGAKRCLPLPVSAPFHSSLMKPAAKRLEERLASTVILPPTIALINNIDVAVESDPVRIKSALVRQAAGPVRWVESVQAIALHRVGHVVECGPGKVLMGMCKRIDAQMQATCVFDPESLTAARAALAL